MLAAKGIDKQTAAPSQPPASYMEKMQIQTTVSAMSVDASYQKSAIVADDAASK